MANTTKRTSSKNVMNFLSYVAIVFVGISLLLGKVLEGSNLATAFQTIAQVVSYVIVGTLSFNFAKGKRHWAYLLVWAISIVLIVVFVVLQIV